MDVEGIRPQDYSAVQFLGTNPYVLSSEELLNSQVSGLFSTFLQAYTSRLNPFLPGLLASALRSNSTTVRKCLVSLSAMAYFMYLVDRRVGE